MNRYHIVYKDHTDQQHLQGQNVDGADMVIALTSFNKLHKGKEIIYAENKGSLSKQEFS